MKLVASCQAVDDHRGTLAGRWKILVAETDAVAAAELGTSLRQHGCEVVLAGDAVAVMTMALRHRPNAVILGALLPAGGAQLALRRVRSSVHTAAIPVIALTEPGPQKQTMLAAGVQACLDLPFDANEVIAALEAYVNVGTTVKGPPARSPAPQRHHPLPRPVEPWLRYFAGLRQEWLMPPSMATIATTSPGYRSAPVGQSPPRTVLDTGMRGL